MAASKKKVAGANPPQSKWVVQKGDPDAFYNGDPAWMFLNDILVAAKKQNHSIEPASLNKSARDRLVQLRLELGSIISLRISGNHRLYGYMVGRVFCILWYDDDHGDNSTCVCRSKRKHT